MKLNNITRKNLILVLFCLLLTTVFFALGYRMGTIRERTGNIALSKLAKPVGTAALISQGEVDRAQEMIERQIDSAILEAILIRKNLMLLPADRNNLEKALKRALVYKSEIGDYHFSIKDLRPSLRKKFLKVKEELNPSTE